MAQEPGADLKPIRRVAVLGAGGLGAAYGARFHTAGGFDTWLIADGERAARLQREGLVVNGRLLHIPVRTPQEADGPADLILVAVKHHHLEAALPDLAPFTGADTLILSLLNGLDSEAIIAAQTGLGPPPLAIVLGIDALREGNVINYAAQGKIFFGEPRNETLSPRVRRLQEALARAAIPFETPPDMVRVMWRKFMINVGINQASALLRAPYGRFQTDPHAQALMETLMREVILLAQAQGIDLTEADIAGWYTYLATLSPAGKTSMLQDIEAGRPTEAAIFGGKVVALGTELGLPTPANDLLWQILSTDSSAAAGGKENA